MLIPWLPKPRSGQSRHEWAVCPGYSGSDLTASGVCTATASTAMPDLLHAVLGIMLIAVSAGNERSGYVGAWEGPEGDARRAALTERNRQRAALGTGTTGNGRSGETH
jgi:hypothetical protein